MTSFDYQQNFTQILARLKVSLSVKDQPLTQNTFASEDKLVTITLHQKHPETLVAIIKVQQESHTKSFEIHSQQGDINKISDVLIITDSDIETLWHREYNQDLAVVTFEKLSQVINQLESK